MALPIPVIDISGFEGGSAEGRRRVVDAVRAACEETGFLVITGHGRSSGGILKSAVPRWLHEADLRGDVLAIAPARPQHGGSGALYVLLRKPS